MTRALTGTALLWLKKSASILCFSGDRTVFGGDVVLQLSSESLEGRRVDSSESASAETSSSLQYERRKKNKTSSHLCRLMLL